MTTSALLSRRIFLTALAQTGTAGVVFAAIETSHPVGVAGASARGLSTAPGGSPAISVSRGTTSTRLAVTDLARFANYEVRHPVRCADCGRRMVQWRGVRLRDLVDSVGARRSEHVRLTGHATTGEKRMVLLSPAHVQADNTLLALPADRGGLDPRHGHLAQLIVPARSGDIEITSVSNVDVLA